MLQSITQSIAAIDFAGMIVLVLGMLFINFSEKWVRSDNKKRIAKGNRTWSEDEIRRKARRLRIAGNILAGVFLVWMVVQFIDIHFFTNV